MAQKTSIYCLMLFTFQTITLQAAAPTSSELQRRLNSIPTINLNQLYDEQSDAPPNVDNTARPKETQPDNSSPLQRKPSRHVDVYALIATQEATAPHS